MFVKGIFFAALMVLFIASTARSEGVVDLADSNFDSYIKSHPVVMVEFYSPGCGHCKSFAPEYERAAKVVEEKKKPYVLARLDVTKEGATADKYNIGKLPTLKLFIKGLPFDYYEERDAGIMMQFIEHLYRGVFPSTELKSVDEIKARTTLKETQVILVTSNDKLLQEFKDTAKNFENVAFFHTSEIIGKQVFDQIRKVPALVVLKDFDEKQAVYSAPASEKLMTDLLHGLVRPKVTEFNQQTIAQLFKASGKKGVVLLRTANEAGQKSEQEFKKLADTFKADDLIFVLSDIKEGLGQRVGKMLDVKEADLPHMEILETKERLQRVKFAGKFTGEEMGKFVQDWRDAKKGEVKGKSDL